MSVLARNLLPALAIVAAAANPLAGQDRVRYYDADGEVKDVRGEMQRLEEGRLWIRDAGGRVVQIGQEAIIELDGGWEPAQPPAGAESDSGGGPAPAESIEQLQKWYAAETRPWARQVLLARAARLYRQQGRWAQAASTFLAIVRDDPATIHWPDAPLLWQVVEMPAKAAASADQLLDSSQPAAQLLGASWLLSGPSRAAARHTLDRLAVSADPPVAALALWQRRRLEVVQVDQQQLAQWHHEIARLPARLAAGPYFLLAQGLARHGQAMPAGLAFLRVGILYNHDPRLAAESLFRAAGQLEQAGRPADAELVYRELLADYAQSRWAPLARQRLLEASRPNAADAPAGEDQRAPGGDR